MKKDNELMLLNITGPDKPGVTAKLTEILAQHNAIILDIGQADIHNNLSLGILVQCPSETSANLMKAALFQSYDLGVQIRFLPISEEDYSRWVDGQGRDRYIITILGRRLTAKQIAGVSRIIADQKMNIDAIKRLTGRIPLDENARTPKASVEFSVRGNPLDKDKMKSDFLTEVIDELAVRAGVGDKVKQITESAMRGEIDFCTSFRERCALLKGLDVRVMEEIAQNLPMTEGADRLMRVLKKVGFKIAILSGGFTYFGEYLRRRYGIDYVYANELEVVDGKLTGRYVGDIVDGKRKAELLRLIAQVENVDIRQTVAVGDGANDLPMISLAGLGIAFHAKPKVKATAEQSISTIGLDGILYFLGYKDSYLEERH